jgi:DNA-binding GntR family transcriptional regulator
MARTPRYLELANALRCDISQGRVALGGHLPTEYALCSEHGVSRHTARAALQVLADEGLIDRRPGLGTKVISRGEAAGFRQALGGLGALMNYAHETQLEILSKANRALSDVESNRFRGEKSPPWLVLSGVRRAGDRLIAATTIYVADWVGAKAADVSDPALAVTEQIEQRFGISVGRIHQKLTAGLLSAHDAAALGAEPGAPMLVAIRRYSDAKGRLFVISESRHPADRFSYEMDFERRRKDAPR